MPALASTAVIAADLLLGGEDRAARSGGFRSALSAIMALKRIEIGGDGVDGVGLAGQFEERRGVALGNARNQ